MPKSECYLDAPRDLRRVRYPSYTGDLGGVAFVDGAAQSGMPARVADRLCGIFGPAIEIVGPWTDTPAPTATEPPAEASSSPSTPQGASTPDDDPSTDADPGVDDDASTDARPRRRKPKPDA